MSHKLIKKEAKVCLKLLALLIKGAELIMEGHRRYK